MAGGGADDVPATLEQQVGIFEQLRAHRGGRGRETGDEVAVFAAQQLIHRYAERFTGDVVQRDVDGRDGAGQDSAALEVLATIHLLPQCPTAHRVFAQQELAVVSDRAHHRQLAPGHARLPPADQPGVGLDLHDELVSRPDPRRKRFDVNDLHACVIVATTRGAAKILLWQPPYGCARTSGNCLIGIRSSTGTPGRLLRCRRVRSAIRRAGVTRPPSTTTVVAPTPTRRGLTSSHRRATNRRSGRNASTAAGTFCRGTGCTWRTSSRWSRPRSSTWAVRLTGRCRTGTTAIRPTRRRARCHLRSAPRRCRMGNPIHSASPHAFGATAATT